MGPGEFSRPGGGLQRFAGAAPLRARAPKAARKRCPGTFIFLRQIFDFLPQSCGCGKYGKGSGGWPGRGTSPGSHGEGRCGQPPLLCSLRRASRIPRTRAPAPVAWGGYLCARLAGHRAGANALRLRSERLVSLADARCRTRRAPVDSIRDVGTASAAYFPRAITSVAKQKRAIAKAHTIFRAVMGYGA